ncbi:MAG: hypothetical protein A3H97_22270 [Acidobacteria bacterium RIFCSPLOWO2_02_FULL_65_29]|nr:MAG: hypothetical protein A3H97_22270 [Acidobacteria bacterium RIFCSPLOWO2_02_FULL_65_29]
MTGDPKIRSRPIRSSKASIASVSRRDAKSLWKAIGSTNCRCTDRIRKPAVVNAPAISRSEKTRYGSVRAPAASSIRRHIDCTAATLHFEG